MLPAAINTIDNAQQHFQGGLQQAVALGQPNVLHVALEELPQAKASVLQPMQQDITVHTFNAITLQVPSQAQHSPYNTDVQLSKASSNSAIKCDNCNKNFRSKSSLYQHRSVYHKGPNGGLRMRKCEKCKKTVPALNFNSHGCVFSFFEKVKN